MVYSFATNPTATPQTKAIPGRESEMVKGKSGAVAFDAGHWTVFRRALLLGTANGSAYADKFELTEDFRVAATTAIAEDPDRAGNEILKASNGKAINNHAAILALVFLSMDESKAAKQKFLSIFHGVVRTGSHFHEWMQYTKQLRGMGKIIKQAGKDWLSQNVERLCYQMLKYPQRYGFSFRDELRLFKPKTDDRHLNDLYGYVVGKRSGNDFVSADIDYPLSKIWAYETLKANPDQGELLVRTHGLTHEMVAPIATMTVDVWQALFETMPIGAMLRNLGSLTEIGVLRADKVENLDRVEKVLTNPQALRLGRIHPMDVLKALKVYASNGEFGRSRKTWTAIPRIVDILNAALDLSFDVLEPTGKVFLHAVDISGSMSWLLDGLVGCYEVAAVMALATAKAEQNYMIRGFSTQFIDLGITASDSFTTACKKTKSHNFGGTDASVAYDWAIANKFKADVFCFWTDSESWAGRRHPAQALAEYRRKVNPEAKAAYTTLAVNHLTLQDPKDAQSYDFAGFDPSIPRAIQTIAVDL